MPVCQVIDKALILKPQMYISQSKFKHSIVASLLNKSLVYCSQRGYNNYQLSCSVMHNLDILALL